MYSPRSSSIANTEVMTKRIDEFPPTIVDNHAGNQSARTIMSQDCNVPLGSAVKSRANKSILKSLLLASWLGRSKDEDKDPTDETVLAENRCMEYGTPPPIEEPNCYILAASESSTHEEDSGPLQISQEFLDNLLIEHAKTQGVPAQLLEDIKNSNDLGVEATKQYLKRHAPFTRTKANALYLYFAFLKHEDVLPIFQNQYGVDIHYSEPEIGLTALHLCAFSNSLKGVKYILGQSAKRLPVQTRRTHTAFHYAAFGNAVDVAKFFLESGWALASVASEESVLHVAARSAALDVLKLLATPSNSQLNRLDSNGYAPIHHALERGDQACFQVLVYAGCALEIAGRKGDYPIHVAADSGFAEGLELLLARGVDPSSQNRRGQTALHLAARAHSLECVELLVESSAVDPNIEDADGRTALHVALGRSLLAYDIADILVERGALVNKADKYGYTALHVAALNELSQCVDLLIEHDADLSARTKGGTSALSIILRKTPTSLNVFKRRLDASITLHQHGSAAGEVEMRLDFHPLLQHQQRGEIGYLGTFVKESYKEILEHPLCQSFLHLKWQKIRKYYVGRLLFYLVYVLVLTLWVITALAHNCYNESHGFMDNETVPFCANSTGLNGLLYRNPVLLDVEWYTLIVLTVTEGLRKLGGILTYSSIRQFFAQAENLVEWCVILSAFATSFVVGERTYPWQNHVGALAVLCGWSNLMLMIGQLPMFGAYVAMFTSVQAQVFKLLLAYACLLVGFTASFCVIFPRSKSFSSPHTGLIKVLVMMTGELDFEELFFPEGTEEGARVDVNSTSWILLQVSAQLSFVLFLLFVTIVLMNLLVGIAVHDIKGLQKTAGLAKLVRQTKLICDLETALFLGLLPHSIMRLLRWTALVLPSPLRVVLTVRPLNPREKRLPREVLRTAYKVARDRRQGISASSHGFLSKRCSTVYGSNYPKSEIDEPQRLPRRLLEQELLALEETNRLREEVTELKAVCESSNKLMQQLLNGAALLK